jgi:hypothetical protein
MLGIVVTMYNTNINNLENNSMLKKIKDYSFKKINEFEAKIIFVVSLVMSLLCMNDVVENKDN